MIVGVTLFYALLSVLAIILGDILMSMVDPRISFSIKGQVKIMNYDLDKYGLSKEELFARVDHSSLESEKITAPRYSYWHSVFRVFSRKRLTSSFWFS